MYRNYYQMKKDAFGNVPELNLFFNSRTHQQAWRYLVSGIAAGEPYLLVTGDYGMGKTLLCMMLYRMLQRQGRFPCAYIPDPHTDYAGMLRELAAALGHAAAEDAAAVQMMLARYFKERARPECCYLIIDDAHELEPEVLERLRALTNINSNGRFPFRLALFAHTTLLDMLREPSLIALGQRIRSRCLLAPLELEEVREYIYYRLYKSGSPNAPLFTDDALQEIFFVSKGVPRVINTLAHACLLAGAAQKLDVISHAVVVEAARTTGSTPQEQPPQIQVVRPEAMTDTLQAPAAEEPAVANELRRPNRISIPTAERRSFAGAHAAEPSRPVYLPLLVLVLMVVVLIVAAGWDYYRRSRSHENLPAPVVRKENFAQQPAPPAPSASLPAAEQAQDVNEPVPSAAQTTAPVEMPVSGAAAVKPPERRAAAARPATQAVPDAPAVAPTATEQQAPAAVSAPVHIIALPPQKSIVVVSLADRQGALWHRGEADEEPVRRDTAVTTWPLKDGLFIFGTDPRKGDFMFHQMSFVQGNDAVLPFRRWRDSGGPAYRGLLPVLVFADRTEPAADTLEAARALPEVIAAWGAAWREKDVERMMSFYSDIVTLCDTDKDKPIVFTRAELAKRRSEVFAKCGEVTLELSEPVCVLDPRDSDVGVAIFSQKFRSATYADEGEKALVLRRENDPDAAARRWKIVGQLWVPTKNAVLKR